MREVTCPRGRRLDSTADGSPGVLCTVIEADNERDLAGVSGYVEPVLTMSGDPSSIVAFCTGAGIPGNTERTEAHGHPAGETTCYTDCPVFRAEVERQERAKRRGAGARLEDDRNIVVDHSGPGRDAPRGDDAPTWAEILTAGLRG